MKRMNYQELLAQHPAIFCHLNNLGIIKVEGPDAKQFLQGQLTCDLNSLTPENPIIGGLYCNIQGRIISAFGLFFDGKDYLLLMPTDIVPLTLVRLKKYSMFSKVTLTDATPLFHITGLIGLQCEAFIKKLPSDVTIIKIPSEPIRYLLIHSADKTEIILSESVEAPEELWRYCDIQSGVANIHPETQEKFLPHELNYQNLGFISFNKGCYLGQEIIARMHYKGKLKYHLKKVIFETEKSLKPGTSIFDTEDPSREIGTVVDALPISSNQTLALVILHEQALDKTRVHIGEELPIQMRTSLDLPK
ncbi:MAG: folate-binding protein YgfZ [Proteobacteria bacterium]|nr:folate-binding protein YgfZ [Pseudomonadota bacterium]